MRMQLDRQPGFRRNAAMPQLVDMRRARQLRVQHAIFDRDGERGQRAAWRVEAAARRAIETPAVQRTLEVRQRVIDGAALMGTDPGQQPESGLTLNEKI